jgi:hypothetical protein
MTIEPKKLDELPIIIADGLDDQGRILAFEKKAEFNKWVKASPRSGKFNELEKKISDALSFKEADHKGFELRQAAIAKRIAHEIDELSTRLGMSVDSEELFKRATSECHVLEGPIFDPITFFEHADYSGAPLHLPGGAWPDFRWFGFNDRASSARISGIATIFEHTWFAGRQLFLGGGPLIFYPNFGAFGFNDLASSAVVA